MTGNELIGIFEKGRKRCHLIGTAENGVIAGLDLEGRLFTVVNGEVVSRVNPDAVLGITDRENYLNPGGDGLWPAPEGTCLGYEYSTDKWRVPPGLTGAKFKLIKTGENHAVIEAEVDLINASGRGIATLFRRNVTVVPATDRFTVKVVESIEYMGTATLSRQECLLAPWSLCQFDSGAGCEVVFPEVADSEVWDMYDDSSTHRFERDGLCHVTTDSTLRFQIGLSENVPWIELLLPEQHLTVKRCAMPLAVGQKYIDIIDAPPTEQPSDRGVRYSVYSDTNGFMEIEAAGGCPDVMVPNSVMNVEVITEFKASR